MENEEKDIITMKAALVCGEISQELYNSWYCMKQLQKTNDLLWDAFAVPSRFIGKETKNKILAAYEAVNKEYWKSHERFKEISMKEKP